jgi:hypothetical protein
MGIAVGLGDKHCWGNEWTPCIPQLAAWPDLKWVDTTHSITWSSKQADYYMLYYLPKARKMHENVLLLRWCTVNSASTCIYSHIPFLFCTGHIWLYFDLKFHRRTRYNMRNTHNLSHIFLKLRNAIYNNGVQTQLVAECWLSCSETKDYN